MLSNLAVIVMASGFGRRFGNENKLLMSLKDKKVIEVTVSHLLEANVRSYIVLVTQFNGVAELFKNYDKVQVVLNHQAELGITASIKCGIGAVADMSGYMFVPGDQLCLKPETVKYLAQVFEQNQERIIVPVYNGSYGSPKIFPASLKNDLMELKGDKGGREVLKRHKDKVLEVAIADAKENRDIDTYEDYYHIREEFE